MPTMIWGTYYLPMPDVEGIHVTHPLLGVSRPMLNGYLRGQITALSTQLKVTWPKLSVAERSSLWTAWFAYYSQEQLMTLPDGQSWLVVVGTNLWDEGQWWSGVENKWYYDVSLTFEASEPG